MAIAVNANPTSASKEPKTTNKTWPARIRGGGSDTDGGGAAVIAMIWTSLSTDFQSHLLVPVMEPLQFLPCRSRSVSQGVLRVRADSLQSYLLVDSGCLKDALRSRLPQGRHSFSTDRMLLAGIATPNETAVHFERRGF